MQDPSYPFYFRITRNGKLMQADEMDKIVCIQAAGLFSTRLSIDDFYYQQRLRGDEQHAAKLHEYAGRLRSWQAQTNKKEAALAAGAAGDKSGALLGSHAVKSVRAPRVLIEFEAVGDGTAMDDGADDAAVEEPLDELAEARRVRARLLAIEKSLEDTIAIECLDDELFELEQAQQAADEATLAPLESKRAAMCDEILKRLDVFVLPYGSNAKLTRSEVQRADAFFLGVVRERKGIKLLARALNVLSLKLAVRVLLFFVRNLLPLATDADAPAVDANVPVVFRHLVGIVGASQRQQVVVAMQTLISFHASQRDLRALIGTEAGASLLTALLSRAHQLSLSTDADDPLASHWREIFKYFASRAIGVLGRVARVVAARAAAVADFVEDENDIDDGEDALRFDALTPARAWSLCVAIALHATADDKVAMRDELADVFRSMPVSEELAPIVTAFVQLVPL
jgi:uncharacterized protein YdcH (DUF465 family)